MFDIAIIGGTVIEPKTGVQTVANLGVRDGKIAAVTREAMSAKEVVDARDKIVCPGFIDIHSHLTYPLYPAWMSARQGITTCLSGNCGLTVKLPIKEYLDELEGQGYPINFATLVGHSWKLREVVGLTDPYATADREQAAEMVRLADQALAEGAFGVSLGLEYAPGTDEAEAMPLAELAARYDKLVSIHIRTDALDFASGLYEAIQLSEKTGAKVQISHLAYQFGVHAEVTEMALVMIANAIAKGLPIECDSGIYGAFATFMQSAVFAEGWHRRYNGRLSDLMISTGKYTGQRCTEELYKLVRTDPAEAETVATAFVGVEADLGRAIRAPFTMISTDAGLSDKPGAGHPQDAGSFPRVFQKLVREQGLLSVMEAVQKSTWMPAKRLKLFNKGHIAEGADADLVVMDLRTVADNADYVGIGQPDAPPTGIEHVVVNGTRIVADSQPLTDRLPGQILRQPNELWRL